MKEAILLIGGGGHCTACIDVIEAQGRFKIAGIVELKQKLHQRFLGYEAIACDEELPGLAEKYKYFVITIGQVKNADKRIGKFEYLKNLGAEFPVIISPSAYVSKQAFIGEGTIVMHQAFVNANAAIGKNCIVNTRAVIEHGVKLADHCHISTGSIINGNCRIGEAVFVGSNSVLANNINVSAKTVIGAGSVVVESIDESGTYAGNPAKRLNDR